MALNQNEKGGKDLLLKRATALTVASTDESTTLTASAAHGFVVGDLWKPSANIGTTILANKVYFVLSVPTSTTFTVSLTKGGAAVEADATVAATAGFAFTRVGGLRSKSFSLSVDGIDITNEDSDEWKTLLDGAGVRSVSLSGSGVYTSQEGFQALVTAAFANSHVLLAFIDVKASRVYSGYFKITSAELSGDYDAESSYSLSCESSGEVAVTAAA